MKPSYASILAVAALACIAVAAAVSHRTTTQDRLALAADHDPGLPSTKPFRVSIHGVDYRLDSASAAERMIALHGGGYLTQMTSRQHRGSLLETIRTGIDPVGSWTLMTKDGLRTLHLAMEFDGAGRVRQSMALGERGDISSGTYARHGNDFVLTFENSMTSIPWKAAEAGDLPQ